jgi:hypothetical protein
MPIFLSASFHCEVKGGLSLFFPGIGISPAEQIFMSLDQSSSIVDVANSLRSSLIVIDVRVKLRRVKNTLPLISILLSARTEQSWLIKSFCSLFKQTVTTASVNYKWSCRASHQHLFIFTRAFLTHLPEFELFIMFNYLTSAKQHSKESCITLWEYALWHKYVSLMDLLPWPHSVRCISIELSSLQSLCSRLLIIFLWMRCWQAFTHTCMYKMYSELFHEWEMQRVQYLSICSVKNAFLMVKGLRL